MITGLVIASGIVIARAADTNWQAAALTVAAVVLMLDDAHQSLVVAVCRRRPWRLRFALIPAA